MICTQSTINKLSGPTFIIPTGHTTLLQQRRVLGRLLWRVRISVWSQIKQIWVIFTRKHQETFIIARMVTK